MAAGQDRVYPLISGGQYHFNANGTKIDFVGGSSQLMATNFHDNVTFVGEKFTITGSARFGDGINNFVRYGHEGSETIKWYTGGVNEMLLENDGDLHVDGDVIAYSATTSDYRLKENIIPLAGSLDIICELQGVKFDWKYRDEKDQIGLIAQNVELVIPEAITEKKLPYYSNEDGKEYKTIKYEMIIPHLIESIKELKTEIDSLKMRLGDS